jgi:hypothetical protein
MKLKQLFAILFLLVAQQVTAQHTSEDSLTTAGKNPATFIGGYGNVLMQYNGNEKKSEINLERVVFFVGHRFNDRFAFFSELEIEDAKVAGGEEGGEVAFEQAYLKMNVSRNSYLTAGLFLPRVGILNENHLPNTFNGNERTQVERYLIPSTWRELGVGFYTKLNSLPVNLSFALVNGLNSEGFEHGSVIRGGRYEGQEASANSLAVTGAVQYAGRDITLQVSGYIGGSVGLSAEEAEAEHLDGGPFGTPVSLGEANIQYRKNGIVAKLLGTFIHIDHAQKINNAYGNGTPESAYGFYGELGYDLLNKQGKNRALIIFGRYEMMDLNAKVPVNIGEDPKLQQQHVIAGINYLPIPQVAVKADVRISSTSQVDEALINPGDEAYDHTNSFINLGIGFSF